MDNDERMITLEVKVAFQDKLLADLDEVIRGMRDELDTLRRELQVVAGRLPPPEEPVVDEKPPHY
jgi:uncharacterized coiled-coil protein SlyX